MIIYNIEKKTLVIPQGFSESSTSQEDYERGVSDGKAQQKALLSATTIIDNGTFTREDGWSAVTVDVPQDARLTTLSVVPQPSSLDERKWVSYAVSSMTGYDGWDIVNVNMTSILEEGARQQKEKLSATTITTNGTYIRNDGWSAVTVNVPIPPAVHYNKVVISGTFTTSQDQVWEDNTGQSFPLYACGIGSTVDLDTIGYGIEIDGYSVKNIIDTVAIGETYTIAAGNHTYKAELSMFSNYGADFSFQQFDFPYITGRDIRYFITPQ